MKEKIIAILRQYPNSRKRTIAWYVKCWQCDTEFLAAMWELEIDGIIKATCHRDPANMEFYKTFSVVGA